jgi:hypothetical protein
VKLLKKKKKPFELVAGYFQIFQSAKFRQKNMLIIRKRTPKKKILIWNIYKTKNDDL